MAAAFRALQRIGRTFDVMHGCFEVVGYQVLGQWGVDVYNGLRHVHTCAEATIESKGDVIFPYQGKCIYPKFIAAVQANKLLMRLKHFRETHPSRTSPDRLHAV